jgi:hypothetical protein
MINKTFSYWQKTHGERKPKFSVEVLTENALHDLDKFRIIVRRGEEWQFAHDRLRAYLVSQALSTKWQEETFEEFDANWLVPLQMLSDGFTKENEAKLLCERVMERRTDIAK